MKKYILISLLFFIIACENEVDPVLDSISEVNMFFVIKADENQQAAIITRSYLGNGFDPSINYQNPFINNAQVRIWYKDTVKIFEEGKILLADSTDSTDAYISNSCYIGVNTVAEMEALLPSGEVLKSYLHSPDTLNFDLANSDLIFPKLDEDYISVVWENLRRDLLLIPRLVIEYKVSGDPELKSYVVPIGYLEENGEEIKIYSIPMFRLSFGLDMQLINKAMADISGDDFRKENYTIYQAFWEVVVFDENLSAYITANSNIDEDFSVNTNTFLFSNIEGASGVFGSYLISRRRVIVDVEYIRSFDYKAAYPY